MKFTVHLIVLAFFALSQTAAAQNAFFAFEDKELPINIHSGYGSVFYINSHSVYENTGRRFIRKYVSTEKILSSFETPDYLYLGTAHGLYKLNKQSFVSHLVSLPLKKEDQKVTAVFSDAQKNIWAGVEAFGAYRQRSGEQQFELVYKIFPVNTGTGTVDSTVWFGTNIGLMKYKKDQWTRYNEEGVANFEIPDNIVERLVTDNERNLWVIMSEGVSVFAPSEPKHKNEQAHEHEEGHIPSARFIGKPSNSIYSIFYIKNAGYLFGSEQGLLFLPTQAPEKLEEFEHSTSDEVKNLKKLHYIDLSSLHNNPENNNPYKIFALDKKGNFWFANEQGILEVKKKDLKNIIKNTGILKTM